MVYQSAKSGFIKMKFLILLPIISTFFGCLEPNTEDIWRLNKIAHVDTKGYCRDVFITGDSVFVAAGQAGVQLYDISTITLPILIWSRSLGELGVSKDISQVEYEPAIQQLFVLESNERPIRIDLSKSNSVLVAGQFSSEQTKELRVVTNSVHSFTVYAADNDDGLKISTFEYDSSFGGQWLNVAGAEIPSMGNPNGIDIYENEIVLTLGQLGIEAFHKEVSMNNEEVSITSSYYIDLAGNARSVTMKNGGEFYIACEDGGVFKLSTGLSAQWEYKIQFAEDLFATHVAVKSEQLAVSCASNGLALFEAQEPRGVEAKGIHDIGYVYHAEFANGALFAATREGLQILEIIK